MPEPETLRSRLAHKPIVVAPGVYDPFTSLVATQAGFETLYVSGAAIAYTRLGRPDIGLVPNNHLAYAGQWFFFAAVAALIYLVALRRRLASRA